VQVFDEALHLNVAGALEPDALQLLGGNFNHLVLRELD